MAFTNAAILALAAAGVSVANAQCTSLMDAVGESGLTTLAQAVASILGTEAAAQLAPLAAATFELPEDQKVTIFAPENDAFPAELPEGNVLADILFNHVVAGYYPSSAVVEALAEEDSLPLTALGGGELTVTLDGDNVLVASPPMEEPAMVTMADIETCAGVIHVINGLLAPEGLEGADAMAPGTDAMAPEGDAMTPEGDAMTPEGDSMAPEGGLEGLAPEGLAPEGAEGDVEGVAPGAVEGEGEGLAPEGTDIEGEGATGEGEGAAVGPAGEGSEGTTETGDRSLGADVVGDAPSAATSVFSGAAVATAAVVLAALA